MARRLNKQTTILDKNIEANDRFCREAAFLRYSIYGLNLGLKAKKKPKRLENSQLLRKTWNVILEQWIANYDREIIS